MISAAVSSCLRVGHGVIIGTRGCTVLSEMTRFWVHEFAQSNSRASLLQLFGVTRVSSKARWYYCSARSNLSPSTVQRKKKIPKPRQLTLYSQFISIVVRTIVRYLSSHIEAVCPKEAVSELLGEKKIVSSTPGEYQCRKKAEITFTLRWCGGVCYRKPRTFGASWPLPWNRAITHYTYSILSIFSSTHKRSRNICVRSEF